LKRIRTDVWRGFRVKVEEIGKYKIYIRDNVKYHISKIKWLY
jgi:hypothetical protein